MAREARIRVAVLVKPQRAAKVVAVLVAMLGSAHLAAAQTPTQPPSGPAAAATPSENAPHRDSYFTTHNPPDLNLGPGYRTPLAPPSMPPILPGTQYLASELRAGMTLETYLQGQLRYDFERADADEDGEVSASDSAIHAKFATAMYRARIVLEIMTNDIDGDGVVTEGEVRQRVKYLKRYASAHGVPEKQVVEDEVRWVMAADLNHDGRITFDEAEAYATGRAGQEVRDMDSWRVEQLLKLAPSGKSAVTFADIQSASEALFRTVDTSGDGVLSYDELNAYHAKVRATKPN
jgi:Ca2+-binding EF-hand superfamily protein